MLSDDEIAQLIVLPKVIVHQAPATGYTEADNHRRRNLDLQAAGDSSQRFSMFVRQNMTFIENYSIGLRYYTNVPGIGAITILRYNGPHGETSRSQDGHFALPHIHRITASELTSGSFQPQESARSLTDRYFTLEEALAAFVEDTAISEDSSLRTLLQGRLFDGS